jgi:predicted RNA-binding protein
MCQTAVYLVREGKEELVLQDVVNITPEGATLKLVNLFGEEKVVEGRIRQIDLLSHRITIHAPRDE